MVYFLIITKKFNIMIIIELYNETTLIQCRTEQEAEAILAKHENTNDPHYQDLQVREVEILLSEEEVQ